MRPILSFPTLLLGGALALGAPPPEGPCPTLAAPPPKGPCPTLAAPSSEGPSLEPAVKRLGEALTHPTVSGADEGVFRRFHGFLRARFPRVHQRLECQVIGRASLLYHWRGRQPDLRPILLLAHQDVVPVDPATRGLWRHPAFAGQVADGMIWGRGARDFKSGLMAILESAEWLLERGFSPARDFWFAFGEDEEVQGWGGAAVMARHLAGLGVRPEFILDEGGGVTCGIFPGIPAGRPVALVGVAEKGILNLELQVDGRGGHAAAGAPANPILVLGQALGRLGAHPFPAQLQAPLPGMFRALGEGMGGAGGFLFRHPGLSAPLLKRKLLENPEGEAMVRTTVNVTRIEGGAGDNLLPGQARALLDIRMLPGMGPEEVTARLKRILRDPRVRLQVRGTPSGAPPLSPTDTPGYRLLSAGIRQCFPGALVVPALTAGTTDIRHYAALTPHLYRFAPSTTTRSHSGNGHGVDEGLRVAHYAPYLAFYRWLLQEGGGGSFPAPRP